MSLKLKTQFNSSGGNFNATQKGNNLKSRYFLTYTILNLIKMGQFWMFCLRYLVVALAMAANLAHRRWWKLKHISIRRRTFHFNSARYFMLFLQKTFPTNWKHNINLLYGCECIAWLNGIIFFCVFFLSIKNISLEENLQICARICETLMLLQSSIGICLLIWSL